MKIYFAGSIRGGRQKAEDYKHLIKGLSTIGTVLTEHIGSEALTNDGEIKHTDEFIYKRDISWIDEADVVIADVTIPSLGVGYELGYAEAQGKKIICLYQEGEGKLSAMISGNVHIRSVSYRDIDEALEKVKNILI